jgi:hypothetical protein
LFGTIGLEKGFRHVLLFDMGFFFGKNSFGVFEKSRLVAGGWVGLGFSKYTGARFLVFGGPSGHRFVFVLAA